MPIHKPAHAVSSLPVTEASQLAAKIARSQADLSAAERANRPTFDDLATLDDVLLAAVLQTADPHVVQLALVGCDPQFVDRIARNQPARHVQAMRQPLAHLGPIRLSEVEAAREELAALARGIVTAQVGGTKRRLSVAA